MMIFTARAADLAALVLSLPICMTPDGIPHRKLLRPVSGKDHWD